MKTIRYRVFDSKNRYQQSYSAELKGALGWATDCARHTNGRVMEITYEGDKLVKEKQIYPHVKP